MKKKILFSAYTLDTGGIETSLVSILNQLISEYDITLILEKKQGIFLELLNPNIKIIEYKPCHSRNILIRKTFNLFKRLIFIFKYKNKYDFAASFATYSKTASFCALNASKNNALWIHTDYTHFYKNDTENIVRFFKFINYDKFKKIVFVSSSSKENLSKLLPNINNCSIICNNLINADLIIEKSNERIKLEKSDIPTFLNVSRHVEDKKIERIIFAAKKLKNNNINFKILLVGQRK